MATVVNYLLTLGSHCGAFHRGSRSSTNCPRLRRPRLLVLFPPMPVEIFYATDFYDQLGVHRRARQRHVGRCSFVFSRRDDTKHTDTSWMTSRRSLHRRRPLARKNLPPTSCCGSDVGRCIMSCASVHPAVVLWKDTRCNSTTPSKKSKGNISAPQRANHSLFLLHGR